MSVKHLFISPILEKHKDKPVPYKYKKWKVRDETRQQAHLMKMDQTRMTTRQDDEVEKKRDLPKLLSNADLFESATSIIQNHDLTRSHQHHHRPSDMADTFHYDDLTLIDEDTRHSTGSFQSVSDITPPPTQSLHHMRSHVTTPSSDILCKTEEISPELHGHSQSLPAASDFLNWPTIPTQVRITGHMDSGDLPLLPRIVLLKNFNNLSGGQGSEI